MLDAQTYLRIVRASAIFDLVVTLAFATPWTFLLLHGALATLHQHAGLPGTLPAADPMSVLLANLMGSVVVIWSLARLRLNLPVLGRYDAAARFLFAAWQVHALGQGMSLILVPILVMEVVFGILQLLPIRSAPQRREETVSIL